MGRGKESGSTRSVERAISILDCFTSARSHLNLTEIVQETGLSKATAFRLLKTLEARNYVAYDHEVGKYRLGPRLLYLGNVAMNSTVVRRVALPVMRELRETSGETVTLFIRQGVWKICVEKVESPHEVRFTAEVGRVLPIHAGASGKVLLAGLDPEQFNAVIAEAGLPRITPNTITSPDVLRREVAEVAARGYAISRDEREIGAAAVGAPVRDHDGKICASLNISGPSSRFTDERVQQFIGMVMEAADKVSMGMGYVTRR